MSLITVTCLFAPESIAAKFCFSMITLNLRNKSYREIVIVRGGSPRECDVPHMASPAVCIDDEIVEWLEWRERKT